MFETEPLPSQKGSGLNLYTGVSQRPQGTFLNWKGSQCVAIFLNRKRFFRAPLLGLCKFMLVYRLYIKDYCEPHSLNLCVFVRYAFECVGAGYRPLEDALLYKTNCTNCKLHWISVSAK